MKQNLTPVRGTNDYLPKEMLVREYVRSTILKTYKKYGFMQISAPILEDINNLIGSDGGDNEKLIFKVLKRGEKLDLTKQNLEEKDIVDIGLRYDLTVPMVRLFSNNQNSLPSPFKSIQIDYSFRADRPQRGRSRQFIQCDIDILGDATNNAEIDILNTTGKTFCALGFKNFVIKINDRRILSDLIKMSDFDKADEKDICICLDKIDKVGLNGVQEELLNRGYQKKNVDKLIAYLNDVTSSGINALKKLGVNEDAVLSVEKIINTVNSLAGNKFKAVFDISIVRGQGYYTGAVYEVYVPGFGGACGGGGRYDNMVEKMTGKSVPAVGFGLGFEPTCMLVLEQNLISAKEELIACIYNKEDNFADVLSYSEKLSEKANVSAICAKKNLAFQLDNLKANGFTKFVKFGTNKIENL
ncbi:MAG: ATP phosphoribosyltransferase regulatory subunit [Clostridia bacterium]|nr:ATP phosphoribosyltransferase regulatory subunit [Clostridia bacterium]